MITELKHEIKINKSEVEIFLVLVINVIWLNISFNKIPNVRKSILDKLYLYTNLQFYINEKYRYSVFKKK